MREVFDYCREGVVLLVASLNPLERSLRELTDLVGDMKGRSVLQEPQGVVEHDGRLGRQIIHIFDVLAEFEREIIRETTVAGLESTRARSRHGGRPKALDENKPS